MREISQILLFVITAAVAVGFCANLLVFSTSRAMEIDLQTRQEIGAIAKPRTRWDDEPVSMLISRGCKLRTEESFVNLFFDWSSLGAGSALCVVAFRKCRRLKQQKAA